MGAMAPFHPPLALPLSSSILNGRGRDGCRGLHCALMVQTCGGDPEL